MTDLLLGIDVGTSACKAAVVDVDGAERAHGHAPTPWTRVTTGAEIDAHVLLDAAIAAGRSALAGAPAGRVRAVGVGSMAEAGVLLDGRGAPLHRLIAWHDARGGDQARRLAAEVGVERFTTATGLPVSALCSAPKLRWLVERHPEVRVARRWLNVAEWVVRGLGGDELGELSLASRTGLLELGARAPFAEALAWTGLRADLLPELALAGTPAGTAGDALAGTRGATLTVAGHDHLVAGVGVGVIAPGDVLDSCGTAEALVRVVAPALEPEQVRRAVDGGLTVGWHVAADRQALLGGVWSGLALQEVLDELGAGDAGRAELDARALAAAPGDALALALDLHSLERPRLRLPAGVAPERIWSAALHQVVREAEAVLDRIDAVAGPRRKVVVTGGWARDEALLAAKARFGAIEHPPVGEAVARGAALLAGVAAGIFDSVDALPAIPVPVTGRSHPRATSPRTVRRPRRAAARQRAVAPLTAAHQNVARVRSHALMDASQIVEQVDRGDLRLVRFLWCGNDGTVRAKASSRHGLEDRIATGIGVTVAMNAMNGLDQLQPVDGMGPVGEIRLVPDPDTFRVLPYAPRTAAMLADQRTIDGAPAPVDGRAFARRMADRLAERGARLEVAFENEFALAMTDSGGSYVPIDASLCFSTIGMTAAQDYTDALVGALEAQGIPVEQYYAELGQGQQEISTAHRPAVQAADEQLLVRETIRGVAADHGLVASLAPKPWPGGAGNGCHIHFSLWDEDRERNRFHDASAGDGFSAEGRAFLAGVLEHLRGLCGLTAPSFNSYRRIVPQFWAGAFTCWGHDNREAPLRLPSLFRGREEASTNVELKAADASANPYLAVGGLIAAGLDGLERGLEPPGPVEVDPATIPEGERMSRGIQRLPVTQEEALDALEADALLTEAMGAVLAGSYLAVRRSEWDAYSAEDEAFEQQGHFEKY